MQASTAPLDGPMVYDGVCNFCSGYVRLVLAIDREAVIRFTPIPSPEVRARFIDTPWHEPEGE